jgi:hypothetical protein
MRDSTSPCPANAALGRWPRRRRIGGDSGVTRRRSRPRRKDASAPPLHGATPQNGSDRDGGDVPTRKYQPGSCRPWVWPPTRDLSETLLASAESGKALRAFPGYQCLEAKADERRVRGDSCELSRFFEKGRVDAKRCACHLHTMMNERFTLRKSSSMRDGASTLGLTADRSRPARGR